MPEIQKYPENAPCWVDLATPDLEGSREFYSSLFGWTTSDSPDTQGGNYLMFFKNGRSVAGAGSSQDAKAPPVWTTYVNVGDADKTAQLATEAGGDAPVKPTEVAGQGRFGLIADANGAILGIWQPIAMPGAQVINEPNSWTWSELTTRRPERAIDFYQHVFGWNYETQNSGDAEYTEWKDSNGRQFSGMIRTPQNMPDNIPDYWMPYFAVADCDAATQKAKSLGASSMIANRSVQSGTFSILSDPQSAVFGMIALSGQM